MTTRPPVVWGALLVLMVTDLTQSEQFVRTIQDWMLEQVPAPALVSSCEDGVEPVLAATSQEFTADAIEHDPVCSRAVSPQDQLQSQSSPPRTFLWPRLGAGLTNQLLGLMASMIVANTFNWTLVLPPWMRNDGTPVPFYEYYNLDIDKLRSISRWRHFAVVDSLPSELETHW